MPRIIIPSALTLWSMKTNTGAPSFYQTVLAYAERGWEVILLCPPLENGASYNIKNVTYIPISIAYSKYFKIKKVSYVANLLSRRVMTKTITHNLVQILEQKGCKDTVIYAYEIATVPACKIIAKKYNLPLVTRFQGTILTNVSNTLTNRIRHILHFVSLSSPADLVIMTNDGTQGDRVLQRLGNNSPTLFLYNGVDFGLEQDQNILNSVEIPGVSFNDIVFMTISRLANWKRIDRAIRGLAAIIEQVNNAKLVIIGEGPEYEKLQTLAQELNVAEQVIFVGSLPHEQVKDYLARADIFLSFYDLSNVGNPLLEAMQCGKAIITLDEGDTNVIIQSEENGILLSKPYEEGIPLAMIRLAKDRILAEKLGIAAQKWAQNNLITWKQRMDIEVASVSKLLFKKEN